MKQKIILITGGSQGIGKELCRFYHKEGYKVLTCARNEQKLEALKDELPNIEYFVCDLSKEAERKRLIDWVNSNYQNLDLLINNAAIANKGNFVSDQTMLEKAKLEMEINFHAPLDLIHQLMPLLLKSRNSQIVNVTTGLALIPRAAYPIYNSTKAALHSFIQVLREQVKDSLLRITEVLMPVVDTPWHQGDPSSIAISAEKAVKLMVAGLKSRKEEIYIGAVKALRFLSRIAPRLAFRRINSL